MYRIVEKYLIKLPLNNRILLTKYQGGKCKVYRIIEKYLIILPLNNRILLTKFRCRNHRLPIESGSRAQTLLCFHCNDISDEYHYLLCCPLFREER